MGLPCCGLAADLGTGVCWLICQCLCALAHLERIKVLLEKRCSASLWGMVTCHLCVDNCVSVSGSVCVCVCMHVRRLSCRINTLLHTLACTHTHSRMHTQTHANVLVHSFQYTNTQRHEVKCHPHTHARNHVVYAHRHAKVQTIKPHHTSIIQATSSTHVQSNSCAACTNQRQ